MSSVSAQNLSTVVDYDELLTRCLNNIDFAERMLTLFHDRCSEELKDLEQAFEKNDFESIRRLAHRLAGASANAAAFGLKTRAAELRHAATDGSSERIRECLVGLRQEWSRFIAAMSVDKAARQTT